MSAFYVGQRIKKVRGGVNVGATAIVLAFDDDGSGDGYNMYVRSEVPFTSLFGPCAAGEAAWANPNEWEPITKPPTWEEINALENLPDFDIPLPETVPARRTAA